MHDGQREVKDEFLRCGTWQFGEYEFASGDFANNKLETDEMYNHLSQYVFILTHLGRQALRMHPDALVGVPNGGQRLANDLGFMTGLPVIQLEKDAVVPGKKTFVYQSVADRKLAAISKRIVAIEDVTTELTSLDGMLELPELDENVVAVNAIWRRGDPAKERKLHRPIHWLVEHQVPNIITPKHPFYLHNRQFAVGRLEDS